MNNSYRFLIKGELAGYYEKVPSPSEVKRVESAGDQFILDETWFATLFPKLYKKFQEDNRSKIKVVAICGKAGSGKDTIAKKLKEKHSYLNLITSCTSRPPRDYETDGIDYNFLSDEEFKSGKWLEQTEFNGWHYGTRISDLSTTEWNIGVFNPAGCRAIIDAWTNGLIDDYIIYCVEADDKIRMMRQLNREDSPNVEEICRRFRTDKEDFDKINYSCMLLKNNTTQDLEECVNIISQDIVGESV